MKNLGYLIGCFAKNEVNEHIMHMDVSMWGAPSECHDDVSKGAELRFQTLEKELGVQLEDLEKAVEEKGLNFRRVYENCIGRIFARDNPFN